MANQIILIAALGLALSSSVTAQSFTTLHNFTAFSGGYTNSDGANSFAGLLSSCDTLYGTSSAGGGSGSGTVFALRSDGNSFAVLHDFTGLNDGASPRAGLILSGDILYGTTTLGGNSNWGSVFALRIDGTAFTTLHHFTGLSDEGAPSAALVLSGDTLYGTTVGGGGSGSGTVFAVSTNGANFTNLYVFTPTTASSPFSNNDGAWPFGALTQSGHTLYGTTSEGGVTGNGTVFAINTDGTGFRLLHTFTGDSVNSTNDDGAYPKASLLLAGDTLYGTTVFGGLFGRGMVFALHTDGTGFTNLHSFTAFSGVTNSDGAEPQTALPLSGNTLYGIANSGGTAGFGTVFALTTSGTDFITMYNFPRPSGEAHQFYSDLSLTPGTLYGTTYMHGSGGNGTVFSLSFPPQLTITRSGGTTVVSYPTHYAGFDYAAFTLQSTTNLASPVWANYTPSPVVVGGWNTVTNRISSAEQFFRLSH